MKTSPKMNSDKKDHHSFLQQCIYIFGVIIAFGSLFLLPASGRNEFPGKGFGDHLKWYKLEEGLRVSKESNKPLMLIIHKSWCNACKALKPSFSTSKEITELSEHFIMVNALDDEEPKEDEYAPDGGYIPRILFIDPSGKIRTEFVNEWGNPDYKYFYSDAKEVVPAMKKVINTLEGPSVGKALSDEL